MVYIIGLPGKKKPVHLKVISYSQSEEGHDVKRTVRFTIEQKSSKESDWQELIREKTGFDHKGGVDYLRDYERRRGESINKPRAKYGLENIAILMADNHPALLKYTRSPINPYPLVTDFYFELPVSQENQPHITSNLSVNLQDLEAERKKINSGL